ncbi:MAG: hypothetical protein ACREV5_01515 [Steroidobacter sp.]
MSANMSSHSALGAEPATRLSPDAFEIHLEALLLLRLECHLWKAHFMQIAGRDVPHGSSERYLDIWELMLIEWIPAYTPEKYERFRPLFDDALKDMRERFERLMSVFDSVLPRDVKKRMKRALRQLDFAAASYRWIPARSAIESPDVLFKARFKGMIRLLSLVARDADQRLAAMVDS